MAIIFQNQTANVETTPVVAVEESVYQIIVSGVTDGADVSVMVSSDGLRPLVAKTLTEPGQVKLSCKAGTSWYLSVTDAGPDTDLDASYL